MKRERVEWMNFAPWGEELLKLHEKQLIRVSFKKN